MDFSLIIDRIFTTSDIEKILYHPDLIKFSTENGERKEIDVNAACFIGVYIDKEIVGLFVFKPVNKVSVEGHCYFLPEHRKNVSAQSYKKSVGWIFNNSQYEKIIVRCNQRNWHVKNFCLNSGFRLEGVLEKSAIEKGKIVDEYILGMTKGQFLEYINV